jgi:hypothetical protein
MSQSKSGIFTVVVFLTLGTHNSRADQVLYTLSETPYGDPITNKSDGCVEHIRQAPGTLILFGAGHLEGDRAVGPRQVEVALGVSPCDEADTLQLARVMGTPDGGAPRSSAANLDFPWRHADGSG